MYPTNFLTILTEEEQTSLAANTYQEHLNSHLASTSLLHQCLEYSTYLH